MKMKLMILLLITLSGKALASAYLDDLMANTDFPDDLILSVSGGFSAVTSSSDLRTKSLNSVLEFNPNVPAGFKVGVETKYIEVGYTFAGSNNEVGKKTSDFQDVRLNFFWRSFDFRLNYQRYEGAEVQENGKTFFYGDYEVKAYNARVHYYFQKDYLRVIREGKDLLRKAAVHSGFSGSGSWFVGVNLDRRRIQLPDTLEPEHEERINQSGMSYDTTFNAFTGGPLAGADGMLQLGTFFLRGKFGLGPAFLPGGNSIAQYEMALSTGFAFLKKHMVTISSDMYLMGFKDDDQRVSNLNSQVTILYTYAF